MSWLGAGKSGVTARDVATARAEGMGFMGLPSGNYALEVTRAGTGSLPLRGSVTLRVVGQTRTIPFTLTGNRIELGQVRIYYEPQLVPVLLGQNTPTLARPVGADPLH